VTPITGQKTLAPARLLRPPSADHRSL